LTMGIVDKDNTLDILPRLIGRGEEMSGHGPRTLSEDVRKCPSSAVDGKRNVFNLLHASLGTQVKNVQFCPSEKQRTFSRHFWSVRTEKNVRGEGAYCQTNERG